MARPPRNPFARGRQARGAERRSELSPFRPPRTAHLPRPATVPILERGPRALAQQLGVAQRGQVPYPPPPGPNVVPGWSAGSTAEWAVFWALWQGYKKVPLVDFIFQSGFQGGHKLAGGIVADFLITDGSELAFMVQGLQWHFFSGSPKQALDRAQAFAIAAYGIQVINIDEDDALRDPIYFVGEALKGVDHGRQLRGLS